jgi:hypothetical protein
VQFPSEALVSGENRIELTTCTPFEFDSDEAQRQHPDAAGGAAISYSEVVLREAESAHELAVTVSPLPLFIARDETELELVDITVRQTAWRVPKPMVLTVGAFRTDLTFDPRDRVGGEVRQRIPVPASVTSAARAWSVMDESGRTVASGSFTAARRWTLHVVPHSHMDLGYTDHAAKALEIHARNVDRVLSRRAAGSDETLSLDGSVVADLYLRERSDLAIEEFERAIREDAVSVNALYAQFLTGTTSLDEWYRSVVFAQRLSDQLGVGAPPANITDVPVYSSAIPSMLAASGVTHFVGMANHCRALNDDSDELHLASPFRWVGPDGAEILAFFGNNYAQLADLAGRAWTLAGAEDSICRFLGLYERDDYLPSDLPILGTHSDNDDLDDWASHFVERWNSAFLYPRLEFSTFRRYARTMESHRDRLPQVSGDGGAYWEEGLGAAAQVTSRYRYLQSFLPVAEEAAVMAALGNPRIALNSGDLEAIWHRLLIAADHTWTADNVATLPGGEQSTSQMRWQESGLEAARTAADDLARRSLSRLADRLPTASACLIALNPSSWTRDLEFEAELRGPVRLRHHGVTVPMTVLSGDGETTHVRFVVPRVPALTCALLEIEHVNPEPFDVDSVDKAPPLLRNPHWNMGIVPTPTDNSHLVFHGLDRTTEVRAAGWEIDVDRKSGLVTRLRHVGTGAELVEPGAEWSFAEVFRAYGGGSESGRGLGAELTNLWSKDLGLAAPQMSIERGEFSMMGAVTGAQGTHLRITGALTGVPRIELEILFHSDGRRIDVEVELTKDAILAKEGIYVAFPFTVQNARLAYERQVGWVEPAKDFLPGACYEWHAAQNAVVIDSPLAAITWVPVDAPLFTVGDIVRGSWPDSYMPLGPGIFSWPMNNHWWTNFPASQEGTVSLRYSIVVDAERDLAQSARFARERRTPALVGEVTPLDKRQHNSHAGSRLSEAPLFDLETTDGIVGGLRADPQGRARAIVRLQDVGASGGSATIDGSLDAWGCDALGRGRWPLTRHGSRWLISVPPSGVCTVAVDGTTS